MLKEIETSENWKFTNVSIFSDPSNLPDDLRLPRSGFSPSGYAEATNFLRSLGYAPIDGTPEFLIWSKSEGDRLKAIAEELKIAQADADRAERERLAEALRVERERFKETPRGQFETEFEILLDKYGFSQIWDLAYCVDFNE
ncbi:hypothetical protein [Burkholderia ubonensis]|uniref:hypothetical protein n=1 Tax=Burkholderia ubonensis TaxID=101571 RepID=UPI000AA8BC83|nr:hypothetical protein [Burkholderia ubonensis]